jgi:hypothetical protein
MGLIQSFLKALFFVEAHPVGEVRTPVLFKMSLREKMKCRTIKARPTGRIAPPQCIGICRSVPLGPTLFTTAS